MAIMRRFNNGFTYSRLQVVQVTTFNQGEENEQQLFAFADGITGFLTDEGEITYDDTMAWINGD